MFGQFLNYRSLISDLHLERMKQTLQQYITKIEEAVKSSQKPILYNILIAIKFQNEVLLNPIDLTLPFADLVPTIKRRVEFLESTINENSVNLSEEGLIEQDFRLSHLKTIANNVIKSDSNQYQKAMLELGTRFHDYINSNPSVENKLGSAIMSSVLATEMLEMGKVEIAQIIANFGLEMAMESAGPGTILGSIQMVANSYRHQGKLDKALEYFEKMMQYRDLPYTSYAYPIRYIGYILQTRGEIDTGLQHYQTSLNLFKSMDINDDNNITPIARTYQNIASIYYLKADFDTALIYNDKSLQVNSARKLKNPRFTVDLLYYKILTLLEQEKINAAEVSFNQISDLNKEHPNPIIEQLYNLTKAMLLKRSKRIKQKAEAQQLLESIVQGSVLNHEYSVVAMQNLCDMLIDEMASDFDDDTFKEAKNVIHDLLQLAEDQQLHLVKVHTLLLQARFDMIQDNVEAGQSKVENAESMCKKHNLNQLLEHVNKFRVMYNAELEKWQAIVRGNVTMKERLANKEIQEYLKMALSAVTAEEPS
jgi:pentatricopeptide repeat protein